MWIQEVSEQVGVSERMLRYYEKEGLLAPKRDSNGYRNYSQADVDVAYGIAALVAVGMEVEHLRVLVPCLKETPVAGGVPELDSCPGVARALQQRLDDLDARLAQLVGIRRAVARQLASLAQSSDWV